MATIVTRAGKGSPLTHDEVDDNFDNLNTDKVETSAIGTAAAANTGDFATAAQGTLADSAVQPNDSPTFGTVTATTYAGDGSALTGVARKVWESSQGSGSSTNYWAKVATYSISGDYDDGSFIYHFVPEEFGAGMPAIVAVNIRRNNGTGAESHTLNIELLAKPHANPFSDDAFKLIDDGGASDIELWVKKNDNNGQIVVYEMSAHVEDSGFTIAYNQNAAWQASEPTGTGLNIKTTGVKVAGNLTAGDLILNANNPTITSSDTDGFLIISGDVSGTAGANMRMYSAGHASQSGDLVIRDDTTVTLKYDASATAWEFQANDITTTGAVTATSYEGDGSSLTGVATATTIKDFGAVGDGVTDDSAAFIAAELAAGSTDYIYLPEGVYSCPETTYVPVKNYYGPGYVKFGGDGTYTDALTYRAPQGGGPIYNPLFNDNKRGLVTVYGSGAGAAIDPSLNSSRFGTFIGDRAGDIATSAIRSTAVGGWAMRFADEPKYFDAFGASAMQYSRTGNKNFGLGNNAAKWLGTDDAVGDDHDFWDTNSLTVWQNKNFEALYPNVRDDLDGSTASTYSGSPRTSANLTAFGDVATALIPVAETDCEDNGAIGRDALIHGLTVTKSLAFGYKSLAQMIDGEKAVAVGRSAGEFGLWHTNDVFIGNAAGYRAIATTDNVFMGYNAGYSAASSSRNVAIGSEALEDAYDAEVDTAHQLTSKTDYKMIGNTAVGQRAGANLKEATGNILLGTKAGQDIGSSQTRDATAILAIQNGDYNSAVPTISGNLSNGRVGINVHHDLVAGALDAAALSSQLTVVEGSITTAPNNANSAARGLLIHREGAPTGITISTDNDRNGSIYFADTDDNNVGGVQYNHSLDKLNLRVGDEVEVSIRESSSGQSIFNISNIPTSASGLSSGDVYSDDGTLKIVS